MCLKLSKILTSGHSSAIKMVFKIVILCVLLNVILCDRPVPKIEVNLDMRPGERWREACDKHPYLFEYLAEVAERTIIPKPFIPLVNAVAKDMDKYLPPDMVEEIIGMANATKVDLGIFALFNMLYDVVAFSHNLAKPKYSGCTSIVSQDAKGTIWHARNLDYGIFDLTDVLRNMTIEVDFVKGGKVLFTTSTYAGLVGLFTAQRPNGFTLSIDERDTGNIFDNIKIIMKNNFTFTGILARQIMEQANTFEEAVTMASKAITPASAYFILGGLKPGQGAVVTRDRESFRDVWRLHPQNNTWFLVETNYDHWKPPPPEDDRRLVANKAMEKLGQNQISAKSLFSVLSIDPVLNRGTTYTTTMSALQPSIYTTIVRDYKQDIEN